MKKENVTPGHKTLEYIVPHKARHPEALDAVFFLESINMNDAKWRVCTARANLGGIYDAAMQLGGKAQEVGRKTAQLTTPR